MDKKRKVKFTIEVEVNRNIEYTTTLKQIVSYLESDIKEYFKQSGYVKKVKITSTMEG